MLPFGQHPETGAFHLLFLCFEFKSGLFLEARVVFFFSFLFLWCLNVSASVLLPSVLSVYFFKLLLLSTFGVFVIHFKQEGR